MKSEITEQERRAIKKESKKELTYTLDVKESFKRGAEFALSELRKPSEFKKFPCNNCQGQGCPVCSGGGEIFALVPSPNSSEELERGITITKVSSEDLVQEFEKVMFSYAAPLPASGLQIIFLDSVNKIATEIAKLIPSSRSQQNDVNVELLEALKSLYNAASKSVYAPNSILDNTLCEIMDIIANAEKQVRK